MAIIYEGLKALKPEEIKVIKDLVEQGYEKIQRDFFNSKLIVDLHKMEKAGKRAKYSVHLRLDHPSLMMSAEEAEWELEKALHKTMDNLMEQVRKNSERTIIDRKTSKVI